MANLLDNELLDLKINSFDTKYIKNPFDLFSKTTEAIWMEIGFGGGGIMATHAAGGGGGYSSH